MRENSLMDVGRFFCLYVCVCVRSTGKYKADVKQEFLQSRLKKTYRRSRHLWFNDKQLYRRDAAATALTYFLTFS